MQIKEIIERVSEIYRDERRKISDLYDELHSVDKKIYESERDGWTTTPFAEYKALNRRKESLETEISTEEAYCEGISWVREMLMDLGFDTEVT